MKKSYLCRRVMPYLLSLLVFALAFVNQSCRDDVADNTSPEKNQTSVIGGSENQTISYELFLKHLKGFQDKELYDHFRSNAAAGHRTTDEFIFPFPIRPSTTDSVRRISINNHTTYTIPVYRRSHTGEVFRNIIIDSTDTGVKAYLAWYFPDKNWIKEYRQTASAASMGV